VPLTPAAAYGRRAAAVARARLAPFVAFALLFEGFNVLRLGAVLGFASPVGSAAVPVMVVSNATTFATMFAAIVLTEAARLPRWRHLVASFGALVAGQLVQLGVMHLLYGGNNVGLVDAGVIVSQTGLRDSWLYLGSGMLLVVYFAFRDHELAATKAAQNANTQRATVERATVAARLKVMQARVEPDLLFDALTQVRDLYLRDRTTAEARLDDLIGYLRAALPQMRSDSSTLGREVALAVAYAKVLPAACRGELAVTSNIVGDVAALPFPPMVLLPLVRTAAKLRVSRITIDCEPVPASCATVRIEPGRPAADWDPAGLDAVRGALAHGFGADASLEVHDDGAVVSWPARAPA
jgi:hypothetical protein